MNGDDITVKLWFALFLLFAVGEAVTVGLVSVWFAGGALAAMLAASLSAPLWLQITVFIVISAVLLYFTRPIVRKLLSGKNKETNLDRIIGKTVIVSEKVDNDAETGKCMIAGVSWSLRSDDGSVIEAGEKVTVDRVEGVKLIVKR